MFLKCIILVFLSGFINAQYPLVSRTKTCPYPHIEHGRVRVRQRSKLVKFMCSYRFELVGNRYATCRNGVWDIPMPVCVRPGCADLPVVANAVQNKAHHDAWVETFCMPGYKLEGSPAIYCNGYRWNSTSPKCVDTSAIASLKCDFESESLCGWRQDELHDFDWERINRKTPSSFLLTGPSYDHTLGAGKDGYYMYIESTSKLENDTARLLSPIYESSVAVDGCFTFFYHMFGRGIGGLKVYQKPDRVQLTDLLKMASPEREQYTLFEQWGSQGDYWYSAAPQLKNFDDNFQIVVEGIRGSSFTSDIAIDDVAILQGANCSAFRQVATTTPTVFSESCYGRCNVELEDPTRGCSCSPSCVMTCCPDYFELCVFDTSTDVGDESPSPEPPQTEKLVVETTTTTSTTTVAPKTTTTTTALPTTQSTTTQKPPTTRKPTTRKILTTTQPPTTKLTTRAKPYTTSPVTTTSVAKPTIVVKPTPITRTTTKRPTVTTTRKMTTTQRPLVTTTKLPVTTKRTTTVVPLTSTRNYQKEEEKKRQEEVDLQKMISHKPAQSKSSSWKTAIITIVVLALFAGLVYLGVALRGFRGRVALARLRGRVTHDSEVRYLSNNEDDL